MGDLAEAEIHSASASSQVHNSLNSNLRKLLSGRWQMNFGNLGKYAAVILMCQVALATFSEEQSKTSTKPGQQEQASSPRFDIVQVLDHAHRLADEARSLKRLDEIPLQARLADTVWPFDQPLAERLLARSFDLTVALLKESSAPASVPSSADLQSMFA